MSTENGFTAEDMEDLVSHSSSFEWFTDDYNWIRMHKQPSGWRVSWTDPSAPRPKDNDPTSRLVPHGYPYHPLTHDLPNIEMAYYFVRGLRQSLDILREKS